MRTNRDTQLSSILSVHGIHVAVVGFTDDPKLPAEDSVLAFVTSSLMSTLTSEFRLPFNEDAAVAMRKIVDGIRDLSGQHQDRQNTQ